MSQMPHSEEFERYYREIDPDVEPYRFSKNETGFYRSKHTYEEYKWFVRGYIAATKVNKYNAALTGAAMGTEKSPDAEPRPV